MVGKKILALGVILAGASGIAQGAAGRNPGHWRSSPYEIKVEKLAEGPVVVVRLRNLDRFAKLCSLSLRGPNLVPAKAPLASRFVLQVNSEREERFTLPSLTFDALAQVSPEMACTEIPSGTDPATVASPEAGCDPRATDCDLLCAAQDSTLSSCRNDHLILSYQRDSLRRSTNGTRHDVEVEIANTSGDALECEFVLPVLSYDPLNPTPRAFILVKEKRAVVPGKTQKVAFSIDDASAGSGMVLHFENLKVVTTCAPSPVRTDLVGKCDPVARPECNWLVAK